jgi:hypothetical protein
MQPRLQSLDHLHNLHSTSDATLLEREEHDQNSGRDKNPPAYTPSHQIYRSLSGHLFGQWEFRILAANGPHLAESWS